MNFKLAQLLIFKPGFKSGSLRRPLNINRTEIIFFTSAVVIDRYIQLQLAQIFIITPGKDGFFDLFAIRFKRIAHVINILKEIGMIKVNIGHDGIVWMIGQEVIPVFVSFKDKEPRVRRANPFTVSDQISRWRN